MKIKVNELQAYKAMFLFLEKYNEHIHADEINILLGSMDLSIFGNDERPAETQLCGTNGCSACKKSYNNRIIDDDNAYLFETE